MRVILASTSPRRQELLRLLGVPFDVVPPVGEEGPRRGTAPSAYVQRLAWEKAQSVAQACPDCLVLGGDTVIELDDRVLGKPEDLAHAEEMMGQLRGRSHLVHTGVALVWVGGGQTECLVETARVWMKDFSDEELARYLETRDSLGKAGAYSIQGPGGVLIDRIEGDYPTVVGLPLWRVAVLLEPYAPHVIRRAEELYRTTPYENWGAFAGGGAREEGNG